MDFGLSQEQRMLIATVNRFITAELKPLEAVVEADNALSPDLAKALGEKSRELGLYAMNMPEHLGGGGLSTVDWILAEEQFGSTTDVLVRRAFGNIYDILLEGSSAQQKRWLLPAIAGDRTCSVAFTEPEAGSDSAAIKTRAVKEGEGWLLNGHKHYISDAHFSDFFVVTAVTDADAGHAGISTFLVDKGLPGFDVGPNQEMMGLRGTTHAELYFDNVRLEPESLLGEQGKGLKLALKTLGRIRLAQVCARAVGKATYVCKLALQHARERRQFGTAIGEFQMVQKMLADSAIEINAARLSLLQAAWMIDQGDDARSQISAVKVQASEALDNVVDRAMQIFGGAGFTKALPIERYYRDARVFRIFDGTSEIHRGVLAKQMLAGNTGFFEL